MVPYGPMAPFLQSLSGVHVETVENRIGRQKPGASTGDRASLDSNRDDRLQPDERLRARIIVYGQSFGGAAEG